MRTAAGWTVRLANRGEATCRVVTGMDENDHCTRCGEVAAVIVADELGFRLRTPMCAEHWEKTREPNEPTIEDIRNNP
jgi:hypothetical protein